MILSELSDVDLSYFGIKDNFFNTDNLINFSIQRPPKFIFTYIIPL